MRLRFIVFLLLTICPVAQSLAQALIGQVTDYKTGEPLPYVNVYYEGTSTGVNTDLNGKYSIKKLVGKKLSFSFVGYEKQVLPIASTTDELNIHMKSEAIELKSATVSAKKQRYTRKENPAVELMRKVIAAKKSSDIKQQDYFSYNLYHKTTFAINDFTEEVFDDGKFKKMAFLKDHVEVNPETGKLTLPISVHEEISKYIYRKEPRSEKTIITGKREAGVNKMFNTGDIMDKLLEDCFQGVNIYEDNIRLFQHQFISPIATHNAIAFYHYFLADTLNVDGNRCIEVDFAPANPQDFGFTGCLFIYADSTYRVYKAILNIPTKSDVNFVEGLEVQQEFTTLPSGAQILSADNMIVQLRVVEFVTKFEVVRSTHYTNFSTEEIPDKEFKFMGNEMVETNAMMRDDAFWEQNRPVRLNNSEKSIDGMIKGFEGMKHFRIGMLVLKALVENFIETSTDPAKPSKFDFGPVNTVITSNFVNGLRLRLSGQTTANLNPHLFAKGYLAYGFKDKRWNGLGEMTYAFSKRTYMVNEFPMHNLTASYQYDVMSPSDKSLPTDKDNVFAMLKWNKVDQMMYFKRWRLKYEHEYNNGLRLESELRREEDEPTAKLFYQPLDGAGGPSMLVSDHLRKIQTTEIRLGAYFQPHAKYMNTKQRRIQVNKDSPIYELYHTIGLKGMLGGDYNYNLTEASVYKRFWVPGAGKIDAKLQAGAQWNKVPYPLLIMPAANLSYVVQTYNFNMIDNMEFLNDRYASLMINWDLNGKIFNRIPLLHKLKWREIVGCNVLWGTLTDKNNPFLNPDDSELFYFPGHFSEDGSYQYSSHVMDSKRPYCEVYFGIHNIFKVLRVQAVRRLTYMDNIHAKKWGLRVMLRLSF